MPDREKVIKGLHDIGGFIADRMGIEQARNALRTIDDAIALMKEQDELLRKKQKDIDRLCNEISEWKHKYHDKLLKEQEAVEPSVSSAEQRCGNCNKVIEMDGWQSCPWCGKMIDWERWWKKNGTRNQDT